MVEIREIITMTDALRDACDVDSKEILKTELNLEFFTKLESQRLLNSFLFNFSKLQDKIGAKLFRQILLELKEISGEATPMRDILNQLEKLEIISNANQWDQVRDVRNALAHDYPNSLAAKISSVRLALDGYAVLREIYTKLRSYCDQNGLLD